jgi:hypothetical protein
MGTGGATALLSPEARAGPGGFGASHRENRRGSLKTLSILQSTNRATVIDRRYSFKFSKNMIPNLQFEIFNLQLPVRWHLHTGFQKVFDPRFNALTFQRVTRFKGFVLF